MISGISTIDRTLIGISAAPAANIRAGRPRNAPTMASRPAPMNGDANPSARELPLGRPRRSAVVVNERQGDPTKNDSDGSSDVDLTGVHVPYHTFV